MPHLRLSILLIALAIPAPAMVRRLHVMAPMRDGIHLSCNIFRPAGITPVPTILLRTPYGKPDAPTSNYAAFVEHGYAVVVQDVRGRHESEGIFAPLTQEGPDGYDTLNWIAAQPWSNGKIGMQGGSYLGIVQWKVAPYRNPHLKAMFPWVSGDDDYRDRLYSTGGALKLGHRLLWMEENLRDYKAAIPGFDKYIWTVPLRHADVAASGRHWPFFQEALNHPNYDDFWQSLSIEKLLKAVNIPVFSVGGWYDNYVESDLDAFAILHKINPANRILIGPWPHDLSKKFADADFGPSARVGLRRLQLDWFDEWLKGKEPALPVPAPVRIFVMGANQWRDEQEWPIARTRFTNLYLDSNGRANTLGGDGELTAQSPLHSRRHDPPDTYVYDPRHPVPTHGGQVCCTPSVFPWGPFDQRKIEMREDVLVYSTPPLVADLEVTGNIRVELYASSTAPDTDFTAKLVDVFPDGVARNLTDGILRARYRESLSKPELLKPEEIAKYLIDVGVTSNLFRKGHRIRIEISSSNFPRFDRNPNTGRPIADETELRAATQIIYHGRKHPSHIVLPVIPPEHKLSARLTPPHPARYLGR